MKPLKPYFVFYLLAHFSVTNALDFSDEDVPSNAYEWHRQRADAEEVVEGRTNSLTMFAIANTNIGVGDGKIPFRERSLWQNRDAPCHFFNLKVPSERVENSSITLCIFRPHLDSTDLTKALTWNLGLEKIVVTQQKIFGYVMDKVVSFVNGTIVDNKFFYGKVSILNKETNTECIYMVEDIRGLKILMRNNRKTLNNMLMVMNEESKEKTCLVHNAVVTKGTSLNDFNRSFIMFSTNHVAYISPGAPLMKVDKNGQVELGSGVNKIIVENNGVIQMKTYNKSLIIKPFGRTIIKQGVNEETLQEIGGAVAITAFKSSSIFDCILPTPAFQPERRGGYVCKVCIALDNLFLKHYIKKRANVNESTGNYLVRIFDRAEWILRSQDFNMDKKSDNIGLSYDAKYINWSYPDNYIEDFPEEETEIIFEVLGNHDFSGCCLGIGYTMKNLFETGYSGPHHAFKPIPKGACAGKSASIINNVVIISANDKQGNYGPITEDQLIYVTANEIARAFGAAPDEDIPDNQFLDDQEQRRHFLMWPDVLRNITLKEQSLSLRSKAEILKTLTTCRSSCFNTDSNPFCGNGIVEDGEECDCGSEYNCELQSCCYSRIGKNPCRKSGVGCKSSGAQSLE